MAHRNGFELTHAKHNSITHLSFLIRWPLLVWVRQQEILSENAKWFHIISAQAENFFARFASFLHGKIRFHQHFYQSLHALDAFTCMTFQAFILSLSLLQNSFISQLVCLSHVEMKRQHRVWHTSSRWRFDWSLTLCAMLARQPNISQPIPFIGSKSDEKNGLLEKNEFPPFPLLFYRPLWCHSLTFNSLNINAFWARPPQWPHYLRGRAIQLS